MKNKPRLLLTVLFALLSACAHEHPPISWGYTVGDPILYDAGHTGNFYPFASPYGPVVYEGEGAIVP